MNKNQKIYSLIVCLVIITCSSFINSNQINATPLYPKQIDNNWYPAVEKVANLKNGTIVAVRRSTTIGLPTLETFNLAFKSTNTFGKPLVAVTTVIKPPRQSRFSPILSIQHFINGLGTQCNPSNSLTKVNFEDMGSLVLPVMIYTAIGRGWTVNVPDHEGPNMIYPGGRINAHITLDSIRATKKFFKLFNSKIGMLGYSGGAQVTGWASLLQHTYAPELNIVGAAQGGIPADLVGLMHRAMRYSKQKSPVVGIILAAAIGMEREYPNLRISNRITKVGKMLGQQIKNACIAEILAKSTVHSISELIPRGIDIFSQDLTAIKDNSLIEVSGHPRFPILNFHSVNDPLLAFEPVKTISARYCRAGTPVKLKKMYTPEHEIATIEAYTFVVDFFANRFANKFFQSDCARLLKSINK